MARPTPPAQSTPSHGGIIHHASLKPCLQPACGQASTATNLMSDTADLFFGSIRFIQRGMFQNPRLRTETDFVLTSARTNMSGKEHTDCCSNAEVARYCVRVQLSSAVGSCVVVSVVLWPDLRCTLDRSKHTPDFLAPLVSG